MSLPPLPCAFPPCNKDLGRPEPSYEGVSMHNERCEGFLIPVAAAPDSSSQFAVRWSLTWQCTICKRQVRPA